MYDSTIQTTLEDKSQVLERVHNEYVRRRDLRLSIDTESLCAIDTRFRSSILRQIEIERFLDENPSLADRLHEPIWPAVGSDFLGFRLVGELGRGSFSRVFLAVEPAVGERRVVIKISADLRAEPHLLGRLDHPGIIPIHATARDNETGLSIICMPYMGCATLTDLLDARKSPGWVEGDYTLIERVAAGTELPRCHEGGSARNRHKLIEVLLELAYQIADAVRFAHSKDVSHGDLKPSNVLLTFDGRPILLDFNLAFASNAGVVHLGGTLPYMAPEVLSVVTCDDAAQRIASSQQADIFSLGILLYELFTTKRPVDVPVSGLPTHEAAQRLLRAYSDFPSALVFQGCPPSIAKLVQACLALDPSKRPSAAEISEELRRELTTVHVARRWISTNRRYVAIAALMFIVIPFVYAPLHRQFVTVSIVRNYQAGLVAYDRGDYASAARLFTAGIERSSTFQFDCTFGRARSALQVKNWDQSLADLEQCKAYDPENGQVYAAMSYCLAQMRRYEDAITHCALAQKHGVHSANLWNNLGYCYLARNREAPARVYLAKALQQNPACASAARNLALLEFRTAIESKSVPDHAMKFTEAALKLAPTAPNLLLESASIYAYASSFLPSHKERAAQLLVSAIENGADPQHVKNDHEFVKVFDKAKLDEFVNVTPIQHAANVPGLVDPIESPRSLR